METTSLPPMTLWQFYAMIGTQAVLGIAFCVAMYKLGKRDPRLGWEPGNAVKWIQDKIFIILIFGAGIASYQLLPDLVHSFTNDASTVMAETVVNTATDAIEGNMTTPEVPDLSEMLSEVIWGEPNSTQHEALMLMAGFWLFLGWCCYVGNFCASPVNIFIKLLKIIAYSCLTAVIVFVPMCLHRFSWDEIRDPFYCLVAAGVLIAATHSWTRRMPPPLPTPKYGTTNPPASTDE